MFEYQRLKKTGKRRKRGGISLFLLGASVTAWWLSKEQNRTTFDGWIEEAKKKAGKKPASDFSASKPDKQAKEEMSFQKPVSSSLVENGAPFSVHYYNDKTQ